MKKRGFPFTGNDVRILAIEFAKKLDIKHHFTDYSEKAWYVWLSVLLSRHSDIALRKAEGESLAKSEAMNREKNNAYFPITRFYSCLLLKEFQIKTLFQHQKRKILLFKVTSKR